MTYQLKDKNTILCSGKNYRISGVKDLPSNEKPREKLLESGPAKLSSAELLAIVFGVGSKREDVLAMSLRILREYGEKGIIYQKNPEIISRDLKVPIVKACQIVACFELGRRFYQRKPGGFITLRNSNQAFDHLKEMSRYNKEQIRGLYLNNHYQLIHDEVLSIGTIDAAIIQARDVFRPALECGAVAIIIAHNHPSGVLKATKADAQITDKLKAAGKILDIELLDHLLIANNKYISLI
ncbi:MAG: DNA repair protein RadC [Patescibacteria group bacterium]|jgi:DNA repair protein RadC|nr:DNA repair protein RadC [Patescibacteria group bacterium]MDD3777993.1 DNA repair protein RadC [Patescibacteria group bacterium]MDD4443692.1 DNA repair protein RadC [Patescibacteria group bacterium]NCU39404.1 DNA repair protein RadC [Candidatus Falkowbacteria bacterium]